MAKPRLTEILNIRLPIISAPMAGGIAGPRLVSAVSNAGGLGLLPIWAMPPDQARTALGEIKLATSAPFGVNLNVSFAPEAHLELALDQGVQAIHFFWGNAAPFIARAKSGGARVLITVADSTEARIARDAGADVLIAQGIEAGGHVWGKIGLHALLPAVVDAANGLPVVAAGGIADGRGVASAFALGASGVLIGTALIVADESGAHPAYKEAIIEAAECDTSIGTLFDIGWPDAPNRVLRNSTIVHWENAGSPPPGKRPGEDDVVAWGAGKMPVPRYSVMPPSEGMEGDVEAMALYAGQGVGLVRKKEPAAAILGRLMSEAEGVLDNSR